VPVSYLVKERDKYLETCGEGSLYFPSRSTMIAVLCGTILIMDAIRINPRKIKPTRIKVVLESDAP